MDEVAFLTIIITLGVCTAIGLYEKFGDKNNDL
jgi:hypothetical protein